MTAVLSGRRPDEVPTRVLDLGTIKWLVSPDLDPGATLSSPSTSVADQPIRRGFEWQPRNQACAHPQHPTCLRT